MYYIDQINKIINNKNGKWDSSIICNGQEISLSHFIFSYAQQIEFLTDGNVSIEYTIKKITDNLDTLRFRHFKSNDDKYYYLNSSQGTALYSQVPNTDNSYYLIDLLLKDATNVKIVSGNSSTGEYYALKNNGNIYKYTIVRDQSTRLENITSTVLTFDKKDYGGNKIIDFNYAGDSLKTFVKTTSNVYRMRITNSTECNKYVDVTCKYKMQEDELFLEYGDRIIFFNGDYLITDYGKKFNLSS